MYKYIIYSALKVYFDVLILKIVATAAHISVFAPEYSVTSSHAWNTSGRIVPVASGFSE